MSVKTLRFLAAVLALAVMTACGDDTQFRVTGTVQGLGTRTIYMLYVADGGVRHESQAAIDGKLDLRGASSDYTVVELFSSSRNLLARMLVKNGQTIHCELDMDNPYAGRMKGNKVVEQWSEWRLLNAGTLESGTPAAINRAVADYVESNRDNLLSSALLLTEYYAPDNESQADSLFALISPQARPDRLVDDYRLLLSYNNNAHLNVRMRPFSLYSYGDSIEHYAPARSSYTLFYFANGHEHRRDTIVAAIEKVYGNYPRRRLRVLDVSMAPDSAAWRNERPDSVAWTRVWAAGGVATSAFDALDIPRLPYYILSDSTGSQVYRGTSVTAALDSLATRLK